MWNLRFTQSDRECGHEIGWVSSPLSQNSCVSGQASDCKAPSRSMLRARKSMARAYTNFLLSPVSLYTIFGGGCRRAEQLSMAVEPRRSRAQQEDLCSSLVESGLRPSAA